MFAVLCLRACAVDPGTLLQSFVGMILLGVFVGKRDKYVIILGFCEAGLSLTSENGGLTSVWRDAVNAIVADAFSTGVPVL